MHDCDNAGLSLARRRDATSLVRLLMFVTVDAFIWICHQPKNNEEQCAGKEDLEFCSR